MVCTCFLLFLGVLANVLGDGDDLGIKFDPPASCSLAQNETFSWAALECVGCQWRTKDSPDYCPCPSNMKVTDADKSCSKCPENSMLYDGVHCLKCGSLNPYSITLERCQPCPQGHIEVAYNSNGTPLEELVCTLCAPGYHPSPSGTACVPCHPSFPFLNGTCVCPEASHNKFGGICFTVAELSDPPFDSKSAYKLEYNGGQRVESPLLREHLAASFYLCKGRGNQTACAMLSAMCTLNLHSYGEDWSPCKLYRGVLSSVSHPPPQVPKLYYSDVEAPSVLIRANSIPQTHDTDYDAHSSDINITLAQFSFSGEFLGLAPIEELIPCKKPTNVLAAGRKFGTNFKVKCEFRLKDGFGRDNNNEMVFLDPYASYGKGKHIQLYPVPIKILNFKRNGVKVNSMEDKYQWQFVRRFFILDTLGSIETGENETKNPKTVRYLKSLHVSVQLQNSKEPGKIYVPLLTLEYDDIPFSPNEIVSFEYSVNYFMDMSRSIEDIKISIGVLSALAVLWSAIQAWSWNRRNGQLEIDLSTISNLLVIACGNLADVFFVVCFATGLFWFVFFKRQVAVHVFLPDSYQERLVRDLLISSFALKIVAIFELIRKQSSVDIFFIDWERPKVKNSVGSQKPDVPTGEKVDKACEENVSIWRTYFIANEWNEIQTTRRINMAGQILASLFFLEVLGFRFWGLHWPKEDLSPDPEITLHIPYSTSSRFVVATLVFGIVGLVQWLFKLGLYERYVENEIQDFVDLCTMGNISVVILAGKQHGYYIHGRSVHGFADTDMQTMIEQLHREEEDLCGRRGLLPQTDQQTFLISVPTSFRTVYNQVLQPLYASSSSSAVFAKRGAKSSGSSSGGVGSKGSNLSIHAYHSMNRFLTAFLEHALSDLDYDITKKTFFESLLDMEFNEVGNDRAVFYTDDGHSFDSVLFYGHERTLFLFELYVFIFVDILSHNFVLAGVVVLIVDVILTRIRNYFGKKNLARKTLIDGRFLI